MLPYTKEWSRELLEPSAKKEITASAIWYEERQDFGPAQVGIDRISHQAAAGHEVLRGSGIVRGELLGGCIESLYDQLTGERHTDEKEIIARYEIFPTLDQWQGKILFVETSEEKPSPEKLREMLSALDQVGVFEQVVAVVIGKPQDEVFYDEYKRVWFETTAQYELPILYNVNFGHAAPRCILPYGAVASINLNSKQLFLEEPIVV